MGSANGQQLFAVDPVCALCDAQVTVIQGAPARQKLRTGVTLYRAYAWCRLMPCGHIFRVRSGELIH